MVKNKIQLRPIENRDLKAVLGLVKELAIYEKEPEAVSASVSDYISAFESGWFKGEVAEFDQEIVGMTIYYNTFSTWKGRMMYLEDFYVKPSHRRYGIGSLLFESFLANSKAAGCVLVKWQVLDWNELALDFYAKQNAEIQKNWWNGIIRF